VRDTHNTNNDMANELKQLETFEISLVPKGANKKVFMVKKSEGGVNMDTKQIEEILNTEVPDDEAITAAFKEAKIEKATDKQKSVISGAVRLLNSISGDIPKLGSIISGLAKLQGPEAKQEPEKEKPEMKKKEEIKKEDLSGLTPEMQASIKAVMKSSEDLKGQVANVEKSNQELKDEIETKKFVTKAEGLTDLGIEADKLGPVLKSLSEKDPEAYKELEPILEKANTTIKKSAFAEIGTSTNGGGTSWTKIEKMAEELAGKDNTITKEQAMSKILKTEEGIKLMQEYRAEKGGK